MLIFIVLLFLLSLSLCLILFVPFLLLNFDLQERRYLLKEFPELLSFKEYAKVLEVGCGNGSTVLPILRYLLEFSFLNLLSDAMLRFLVY